MRGNSEAARWFERLQNEELGTDEIAEWQQWLARSPANRRAFDRFQGLWEALDRVPPPVLPSREELAADSYAADMSVAEWRKGGRRRGSILHGSIMKEMLRRFFSAGFVRAALAAALVIVVCASGLWGYRESGAGSGVAAVYETRTGEHREARLPDGSRLTLGAKSLVWIGFARDERSVVLERGEAFFEVAKDGVRPFVVRVGNSTITAVGTAFNVRKTGERVLVAVSEGVVNVAAANGAPPSSAAAKHVRAGEEVVLEAATVSSVARPGNAGAATAWRAGRLEYLGEPLKYVVADVNRYSDVEISIGDAEVGDLLMTGTVFESDVDGWLSSVTEFLPVRVERREDGRVVLRSARSSQ